MAEVVAVAGLRHRLQLRFIAFEVDLLAFFSSGVDFAPCRTILNTPFALPFTVGAPVLYVELVQIQSADNSSFRLYGQYDTPLDAARSQTEDGRKKFVHRPISRRVIACSVSPVECFEKDRESE